MKYFILTISLIAFISCTNTPTPKPSAYLSLNYSKGTYKKINKELPFSFNLSDKAVFNVEKQNWSNIYYPKLKAEINITYQEINNNLAKLILDSEKLTYKHTLIADDIEVHPFDNYEKNVYARMFQISGDAASPIQFQATDSVKNFISGSLYFDARPNYDSILPVIDYMKKDIKKLIETLEWKN